MTQKVELDKYYTPTDTAKYCIDKAFKIIGFKNVTNVVEPSAGNGAFSSQIKCAALDIQPEADGIHKKDYLKTHIPYRKGRLIIGNPPFGSRMNLAQKFFKKSVRIGDHVAFILPISQLNNTNSLYEFDLVHSEDLGMIKYSDRNLNCCFNVYSRPKKGLNARPITKLKSVKISRQDSKGYDTADFDVRMCYWGTGSAGKILKEGERYSGEYKIKIDPKYKERVIDVLERVNWSKELKCIASLKIQQYHIVNLLSKNIPEIK